MKQEIITLKKEIEERNELLSRKHKKVCTTPNYIEHFLILASAITQCISISVFASLFGILKQDLKICAKAAGIKKYQLIIRKKKEA